MDIFVNKTKKDNLVAFEYTRKSIKIGNTNTSVKIQLSLISTLIQEKPCSREINDALPVNNG
jgi:hypothetical protein